jgi:tRNA(Arg) A34 adenosine deaminase TadA
MEPEGTRGPQERIEALLDVIEHRILPLTEAYVRRGHNLFGGAVLDRASLAPLTVGSNRRGDNPILHGEIETILRFFEDPGHPAPEETVFLATHEPCSMCLSALAWAGFREVWYLFEYAETAEDFHMPDDLKMLRALFGAERTNHENEYLSLRSLREAARDLGDPESGRLLARMARLKERYRALPVAQG